MLQHIHFYWKNMKITLKNTGHKHYTFSQGSICFERFFMSSLETSRKEINFMNKRVAEVILQTDLKNGKLISPAWLNRAEQFRDVNKKENKEETAYG